jgi:hypothetical protein
VKEILHRKKLPPSPGAIILKICATGQLEG